MAEEPIQSVADLIERVRSKAIADSQQPANVSTEGATAPKGGDQPKMQVGGSSTSDGMVVLESGGGGLSEVKGEAPPPPAPKPAPEIAPPPPPAFSAMADRARSAATMTASVGRSAEQGA